MRLGQLIGYGLTHGLLMAVMHVGIDGIYGLLGVRIDLAGQPMGPATIPPGSQRHDQANNAGGSSGRVEESLHRIVLSSRA